jgi:hypothetical protein
MDQYRQANGYPKVAQLFDKYPTYAIVRRFGFLNMMSLLSLQGKLMALEKTFRDECDAADISRDDSIRAWTRSFGKLEMSRQPGHPNQHNRPSPSVHSLQSNQSSQARQSNPAEEERLVDTLDAIRNTVKEYSELPQ